jgi:hypothetical protein
MAVIYLGIGGTGARVLESFAHLCAMGLGPREQVYALIIDPDASNGNISRTKRLLHNYRACRRNFGFGVVESGIFSTGFEWGTTEDPDALAWPPVNLGEINQLKVFFDYSNLQNHEVDAKRRLGALVDMLYTQGELDLKWDQGFKGRPAVGAPVMSSLRSHVTKPQSPLHKVNGMVQAAVSGAQPLRVFIVGSLFGATGASGFPALARIFRNTADAGTAKRNLLIGGAPVTPYYGFEEPTVEQRREVEDVYANPKNFIINTAAALRYYADYWRGKEADYDAIYLVGHRDLDSGKRKFKPGGAEQKNPPHFVEMLAAMAACDFYQQFPVPNPSKPRPLHPYIVARLNEDSFDWQDMPAPGFKKAALGFLTFAHSFLGFYDPLFGTGFEKIRMHLPWYLDAFPNHSELQSSAANEHRGRLGEFLGDHLAWWRDIHQNSTILVRLLNPAVLGKADGDAESESSAEAEEDGSGAPVRKNIHYDTLGDGQLRRLAYVEGGESPGSQLDHGYDFIWERLCEVARDGKYRQYAEMEKHPMGRFVYLLHQACADFVARNYMV